MRYPLFLILGIACGCQAASPRPPTHATLQREIGRPLAVISGDDSHITQASFRRVETDAAWQRLWLDHLGLGEDTIYRPKLDVDLARCTVVAIFDGRTFNRTGMKVDSVARAGGELVVRYRDVTFQTSSGFTSAPSLLTDPPNAGGGAVPVTPFAFVVLPKTDRPIIVEEDLHRIKGGPPLWKQVAKLEPQ